MKPADRVANEVELGRPTVRQLVIVDIQTAIIDKYAEIHSYLVESGKNVGDNDVWIAATAAAASALLITTDKDFEPLAGTFLQLSRFDLSAAEVEPAGSGQR